MEARSLERRFNPGRIALLVRNRLFDEVSVLGIGAAIVLVLNLMGILFARRAFFNAHGGGGSFWIPAIFLAGLLAAQAFKGMHDGKAGTEWVLLPATPLEKYAAAFVDLVLLIPLACAAASLALSALLSLLERWAGGTVGAIWTPFSLAALKSWADYAVAMTVLLAGSAAFRKAALIKTIALGAAYGLVIGLLCSLGFWAILKGGSAGFSFMGGSGQAFNLNANGSLVSAAAQRAVSIGTQVASYAILPAFAILYGAARVAEKESRDEVQ